MVTLIGAAFTAAGVWIADDGAWPLGVVVIAFFGPCTCVGVWVLVPGSSYLRPDPAGLAARTPFRTLRHSWDEIDNFRPLLQNLGSAISPESIETDAGLPDTYGRDPGELVQLLRMYRDRYATDAGAPGEG